MVGTGRVVGGDYLNAVVSTRVGSTLVVQAGFKFRKLTPENVAEWTETTPDGKGSAVGAVSKAVAGAVLPGQLGKAASAAVGATFDSVGPSHIVRVDWLDGRRSVIKLPDAMFKHFETVLRAQRVEPVEPVGEANAATAPAEKPTVTEQAFSFVAGIVKDRFPTRPAETSAPLEQAAPAQPDLADQLTKLASLRDSGILTEEEFAAKKAELLARM
ncbi:SHOCT domain-containing protein [Agromyces protaetiae]|uniref:SHOCT domain-containing protein n=1 Tax=Agromyces protaetiae TaxID=2509455 RepID=A0A4P6F8Y4_9MICO|nr:SHOCT domain-containing protein [Agromyces protaetiae]QAY72580.1 SHOCT domain-containing protein [Agromyces protaetiae]